MKKIKWIVFFSCISIVLFTPNVWAASLGAVSVDTSKVLLPTDNGMKLYTPMEGVFTKASGADSQVLYSPKDNNLDTAIMITEDKTNQKGAIWSQDAYRLDLSKPFTSSMWLYMSSKSTPADGMAFVMHNDSKKTNALMDVKNYAGSRLGVWGFDSNVKTTVDAAKGAIQNSLAIELDTYKNSDTLDSDNSTIPHIAWNYPAQASSYKILSSGKFSLIHRDAVNLEMSDVVDSKWHHFSLSWQPSDDNKGGYLTYTFNDKTVSNNKVQLNATNKIVKKTITISDYRQIFGLSNLESKVYWGFTGSTGGSSARNIMTFENIPGLVTAAVTESVIDTTRGVDITKNGVSYNNNELQYVTHIKYDGQNSKFGWSQLVLTQTKNKNVNLVGSTVQVDYFLKGQKVGKSKTVTPVVTNNQIMVSLGEDSNFIKENMGFDEIRVTTPLKVQMAAESNVVIHEDAVVDGNTAKGITIVEGEKPNYIIKGESSPEIQAPEKQVIFPGDVLTIPITIKDDNATALSLDYQLEDTTGQIVKKGNFYQTTVSDDRSKIQKGIDVTAKFSEDETQKLNSGQYVLKLTVTNNYGKSTDIEMKLTIREDQLQLESVPNLIFDGLSVKDIATSQSELVSFPLSQKSDVKIKLSYTNPNRNWQLSLAMNNFKAINEKKENISGSAATLKNIPLVLDIQLDSGDSALVLNADYGIDTFTMPQTGQIVSKKAVLLAKKGATNTGMLTETIGSKTTLYMGAKKVIYAGTYRGDLIWTLSDVPQ